MVDKMNRLEQVKLTDTVNYHDLVSLSLEAREKLTEIKPKTIGQASRISGVSPSDVLCAPSSYGSIASVI